MRILSTASVVDVAPGQSGEIPIEVVNTGAVIDSFSARVIGLPVEYVDSQPAMLPLFPDATGRLMLQVQLPEDFPAGTHPVSVEVTGQAPGAPAAHHDLDIVVSAEPALALTAVPATVRARRKAAFNIAVRNSGNLPLDVALSATDSDRSVQSELKPSTVNILPGQVGHSIINVRGPRHLFGSEADRPLRITGTAADLTETIALTYRQRPLITRGVLIALVLLAIVAVWAAIFLFGIYSALGSDPLTRTAPASFFVSSAQEQAGNGTDTEESGAPAGALARDGRLPAGVGGTVAGSVVGLTDGEGVGRITVDVVREGRDGPEVVGSSASQADGTYDVGGLFPGEYLLRFSAEGFDTVWYPDASGRASAEPVAVQSQNSADDMDVVITGHPGSISGTVDLGDVTDPVETTVVARATWTDEDEPITVETTADEEGAYTLPDLPAPGTYELTFEAEGYDPATITERITGAQERYTTEVLLGADAGQISGTVTDGTDPLGGVTITTTVDDEEIEVGTPTLGNVGTFTVPGLPTPGTYVLTVAKEGFTTATVAVDLSAGESLVDVDVELEGGAGTVTGRVTDGSVGLGGVQVTVGGAESVTSATTLTSGDVGAFTLSGLEPGAYTLTFELDRYQSVSIPVDLTNGSGAPVEVTMRPALGAIDGVVTADGDGLVGEEVRATDGNEEWTTTTTTRPDGTAGYYQFADLPPGRYTVTVVQGERVVATVLASVRAGDTATQNLRVD